MTTVLQTPWQLTHAPGNCYLGIETAENIPRPVVQHMEEPGAGEGGVVGIDEAEHIIALHNDRLKSQQHPPQIFVLLEDFDGTMRSVPEPFGAAVTSQAEADLFVNQYPDQRTRRKAEPLRIFETTQEAMAWRWPGVITPPARPL